MDQGILSSDPEAGPHCCLMHWGKWLPSRMQSASLDTKSLIITVVLKFVLHPQKFSLLIQQNTQRHFFLCLNPSPAWLATACWLIGYQQISLIAWHYKCLCACVNWLSNLKPVTWAHNSLSCQTTFSLQTESPKPIAGFSDFIQYIMLGLLYAQLHWWQACCGPMTCW